MQREDRAGMSLYSAAGERKYLTADEQRRFFRAAYMLGRSEFVFCLLLAWSGGRLSEVLATRADSVDLQNEAVAIRTLKRRKPGVVRQVPMPPLVIEELQDLFNLRALQMDVGKAAGRLWSWSRSTAWRRVKRVMHDAGIGGVAASPKGLRHTFGVRAFERQIPPHLVQRWLGHASLKTTAIYGDVIGEEERKIAERMWRNTPSDDFSEPPALYEAIDGGDDQQG